MKIGFDARMYGLEHAGIGRYIKNLLHEIIAQDTKNQYTVFLPSKKIGQLDLPHSVVQIPSDIRHYTVKEQTAFLTLLNQQSLDLVHFPHFNVPLLYNRPFVVTIHDILWHQQKGMNVTTLKPFVYALKYLGYRAVVRHAVFQSRHIITPSKWVANEIVKSFPALTKEKITAIYEGVDDQLKPQAGSKKIMDKFHLSPPFFVYTGSAYPHKNIPIIFRALKKLETPAKLAIVGSRNIFLKELKRKVKEMGLSDQVIFTGYLEDQELTELYSKATALILPSRSEGFGLTGLEAMQLKLPVISSSAGSLPEVYGDAALFFDPNDGSRLTEHMQTLIQDKEEGQRFIKKGITQAKKYSWKQTAKQTLEVYHQVL